MAEEEEASLEAELEAQVVEQEESLRVVAAALLQENSAELLQVQEELLEAVKVAKEGLLHLKRARLLREVDGLYAQPQAEVRIDSFNEGSGQQNKTTESLTVNETNILDSALYKDGRDKVAEGSHEWLLPGALCRFRHGDGRWYTGEVLSAEEQTSASRDEKERQQEGRFERSSIVLVGFAHPTSEQRQTCWFFRQNRCRFGDNCRLSHGLRIPSQGLRPYVQPDLTCITIGSTVLATAERDTSGLWRRAELESRNDERQLYGVAFVDDGSRAEVQAGNIALLEYKDDDVDRDSEDASNSSREEGEDDEEAQDDLDDSGFEGLGRASEAIWCLEAAEMARAGIQTETINFANWEKHTRGIASKMMASMGFREGMGLGRTGQGISKPLEVRVLPPKRALDFLDETTKHVREGDEEGQEGGEGKRKRKGRGGERRRRQKLAAAAKLAQAENDLEYAPDVFSFINGQLSKSATLVLNAGQLEKQVPKRQETQKGERKAGLTRNAVEERVLLLAREDELKQLALKISKLEEMASRNKRDKVVYSAVQRKLEEERRALARAEGAHASQQSAIHQRDHDKKWMKF